ncbi:hypothetical protein D3C73_1331390 [compost metagenome]
MRSLAVRGGNRQENRLARHREGIAEPIVRRVKQRIGCRRHLGRILAHELYACRNKSIRSRLHAQ